MQAIQSSFETILSQHFHVVPVRTQRQDQWYKRTYQAWKSDHASEEPLILASKTAQEDWLSELNKLAILAARSIRQDAKIAVNTRQPCSKDKLFSDDILSKDIGILGPDYKPRSPLKPAMQRLSYWTKGFKNDREEYWRAIKALLAADRVDVLYYIAAQNGSQIENAAFAPTSISRANVGWATIVDETLELLMSLMILKAHSEKLPLATAYDTWVPFAFARSTTASRLRCILPEFADENHRHGCFQSAIDWCFRVLIASCSLLSECNITDTAWEQRIIDAFLHFVGFEAWNREREGEGYLGCTLNTKKDGAWLKRVTGSETISLEETDKTVERKKKMDPLRLRDTEKEEAEDMSEEEREFEDELASVEAEERAYGLKKSVKYRKKRR